MSSSPVNFSRPAQHGFESTLSDSDFFRIVDMLANAAGIHVPDSNRALVYSRLSRRVKAAGCQCFGEYLDFVESEQCSDERELLISALTTNTTRFFREPYHFEFFEKYILDDLMEQALDGKRIRLWSAACSTGEEPYSLAAVVLHGFPKVSECDFKILATDVSRGVLESGRKGIYSNLSAQCVPEKFRSILFDEKGADSNTAVRDCLKDIISFRYLNFMEPWPVKGPFQVIFCRNAVIYMKAEMQAKIWSNMSAVMEAGSTLFVGHSERMGREFDDRFVSVGKTTFRRV